MLLHARHVKRQPEAQHVLLHARHVKRQPQRRTCAPALRAKAFDAPSDILRRLQEAILFCPPSACGTPLNQTRRVARGLRSGLSVNLLNATQCTRSKSNSVALAHLQAVLIRTHPHIRRFEFPVDCDLSEDVFCCPQTIPRKREENGAHPRTEPESAIV